MGIWRWLTGGDEPAPLAAPVAEEKAVSVSPDLWAAFNGSFGVPTKSGVPSSTDTALQVPAFYRGVMVIADGISQLPVEIYRCLPGGKGSEPAIDHPLYDMLRHQPSSLQDAFQFFTTVLMHAAASGNSVSYKVMVNGQVRELIPIRPESVSIDVEGAAMRKRFDVTLESGVSAVLSAEQVFHLSGPSWRPFKGMDPAYVGREAIGLARATEESQARLHSNGVRPSGILSTDQKLDRAQIESLREQLNSAYAGVSNAMKTLIAGGGLKFTPTTMSGVDAQHLETRKMQIEEICRVLGVFPIMVGHAGDQSPTFASAEAFFDAHVRYTLQRWIKALKAAIETQLLTKEERDAGYYVRIDTSELTRGSLEARTRYYQAGLGTNSNPGWLTPNEVREDDGWNPLPDLDSVMSPLTMTPADQQGAVDTEDDTEDAETPDLPVKSWGDAEAVDGFLFHWTDAEFSGLPDAPNGWAWFSSDKAWSARYGRNVKTYRADGLRVLNIPMDPRKAADAFRRGGVDPSGVDWALQESYRTLSTPDYGPLMARRVDAAGFDGVAHVDNRYAEGRGRSVALTRSALRKLNIV